MKFLILWSVLFYSLYAVNSEFDIYMASLQNMAQQDDQSFKSFSALRGKEIFESKHIGKKGKEISCSSCHMNNLMQSGENLFTGKIIEPLSPSANAQRLNDVAKIEKWLKRNFNDVYNRQGSAQEKGDVLRYIIETK